MTKYYKFDLHLKSGEMISDCVSFEKPTLASEIITFNFDFNDPWKHIEIRTATVDIVAVVYVCGDESQVVEVPDVEML